MSFNDTNPHQIWPLGESPFSPELKNRINEVGELAYEFASMRERLERRLNLPEPQEPRPERKFPVLVSGSELMPGEDARWFYRVGRVFLDADGSTNNIVQAASAVLPIDDPDGTRCINLREVTHIPETAAGIPWYVFGIDLHSDDYEDVNITPLPFGGGPDGSHQVDMVTEATAWVDKTGTPFLTIDVVGSVHVVCA